MAMIWEFFENLEEIVYVTNMANDEIVYLNKKALNIFGVDALEHAIGRKCHEVIQNSSEPCKMCNNKELVQGKFYEWKFYNPILDKFFLIKDTMICEGDMRYRMEIAVDITMEEKQESIFHGYKSLEAIVNEALRLSMKEKSSDMAVGVLLEYLGKALNGERTYIFERNEQGGDDNTYEWVAAGVTPEKENLQNLPPEVCSNWYRNFREDRNIVIENLEEIKESDPLQYENLKQQNIHSIVVVPLYDQNGIIGFFGVDNPPVRSLGYATDMLQIMGHFIMATLEKRNMERELFKMSYTDQLTGLGNRFAMHQYLSDYDGTESLGMIFCDITGLKKVNDSKGHHVGDVLIMNAAKSLKTVYHDFGLFRIGGDELLVLCKGVKEAEFFESEKQLKIETEKNKVILACGAVWEEKCTDGLEEMLKQAEQLMYEDKALYYKNSGDDRRTV